MPANQGLNHRQNTLVLDLWWFVSLLMESGKRLGQKVWGVRPGGGVEAGPARSAEALCADCWTATKCNCLTSCISN